MRFDGEVDLVYGTEYLVDFANCSLPTGQKYSRRRFRSTHFVFQVDGRIEIWDLKADRFANDLTLARMEE